ncbi:MAG: amidohydrolase family protein [Acidobacteriota bacterium]
MKPFDAIRTLAVRSLAVGLAGLCAVGVYAQDEGDAILGAGAADGDGLRAQINAAAMGDIDLAIFNATVHSLDRAADTDTTVIVQDGKIRATGRWITVPEGVPTVDAGGKHLFPGFIQAFTTLGLIEIGSVRGTRDVNEIGENNADLRAEVAFNADSLRLPPSVRGGVLAAHVRQSGGLFAGTTAVMRLEGWNWRDMAVKTDAGMVLNFPQVADGGDDDGEAEKALKALNQLATDVAAYGKARDAASPGLALDAKMDALIPVFKNELKLFVVATGGRNQIDAALDWIEEKELTDVVLVSNYEARYVKDRLADASIPVIITDVLALPSRDWEPYDAAYSAPAALHEAGVTFAIAGEGNGFASSNTRNLPFHAAMAAAFGLPRNVALKSVTQTPAEILGVADRLGKIEAGREATFFLANSDVLEIYSEIERVWIAGREVDLTQDHQYRLYRKYQERPRPVVDVESDAAAPAEPATE